MRTELITIEPTPRPSTAPTINRPRRHCGGSRGSRKPDRMVRRLWSGDAGRLIPDLDLLPGIAGLLGGVDGIEQGLVPIGVFAIDKFTEQHDPAFRRSLSADPEQPGHSGVFVRTYLQ